MIEKEKKKQKNRVKQQLCNTLKKAGRGEPGGLAGIQKQMFREVTWSNFEPWRWTGTKNRWKGYQMKIKTLLSEGINTG